MAEGRGKRKRRAAEPKPDPMARMKEGYAKSEQRNQAVRDSLEPLGEGERPRVLTAGAAFSAIVATIFWTSGLMALFGNPTIDGKEPNPFQLFLVAIVMTVMAVGLWRARYWAALGFQMLLVILILALVFGMVLAPTLVQILGTFVLTVVLGVLFFHMVKAMARLQMPERPGR